LKVAGVDEAGRGALAGPVVAAAVILADDLERAIFKDSKQLNPQAREEIYTQLRSSRASIGVGVVDNKEIDQMNILAATMLAMKIAIEELKDKPQKVLVDGNKAPHIAQIPMEAIIKGDTLYAEIAAASIVAKVTRDRMMMKMHDELKEYAFDVHKGYGTDLHYERLFKFGISRVHRRSFNLNKQERLF
jgi:ribonuclease HII